MDADRWQQVKAVFEQALVLPPEQREAFAEEQAGSVGFDEQMRAELMALIAADEDALDTLPNLAAAAPDLVGAAAEQAVQTGSGLSEGTMLGRWRILQRLGSGGMGTVYLAERSDSDFQQLGALKLIEANLHSEELQRRFRDERRILAALDHPGIARLLDGDELEGGQPFLVMEYVDGLSLDRYCNGQRLGLEARLKLLLQVCAVVAAAHRRLVVHRDLKPSNILVDQDGKVRLLDFGIARLIEEDGQAAATRSRQFTPEYAAPEQVRGEPATTSVDVHALGLLMYQLLTGTRPWAKTASTPFAYEQAVLNEPPTLPSKALDETRSQATCQALNIKPEQLRRRLRGDLDAIMMKALRKEPEARYGSVEALAEDIQRFLDRLPVMARRGSWRYQAQRFIARHALASMLALGLLVVLAGGLALTLWQADIARQQRDQARQEALTADRSLEFMTGLFHMANPAVNVGEQITAREMLDRGVDQIHRQLHDEPVVRARLLLALGQANAGLEQFEVAMELVEQAMELAYDSGQPLLIGEVLMARAALVRRQGDTSSAVDLLHQALALTLPSDIRGELLRGQLEWQLAVRLQELSDLDLAEHYYLQASQRLEKAGSPVPPQGWIPYSGLLTLTDRVSEAEALLRDALDRLDPDDPGNTLHRANLLSQHATMLMGLDRHEQAIAQMHEAIAAKIEVYGDDHHTVDVTRHNLASHLANSGQNEAAEPIFKELLLSFQRRFGDQHPNLAASQARLGRLYLETGRVEASIPLFIQSRDTVEARLGVQSFTTGTANTGLGRAYLELGDIEAARSTLTDAVIAHEHNPKLIGLIRSLIDLTHIELNDPDGPPPGRCQQLEETLGLVTGRPITYAHGQFVLGACLRQGGEQARGSELMESGLLELRELVDENALERRLAERDFDRLNSPQHR